MQAELEASAESGATVTITLPDTAQQLQVAVGQEWVHVNALGGGPQQAGVAGSRSASGRGGGQLPLPVSGNGAAVRSYFVKRAQDETGALAVSEVVLAAAAAARHQQQHQHQQHQHQQLAAVSSQAGGLAAVAPVAG